MIHPSRLLGDLIAAHADWSTDRRKRWMSVASGLPEFGTPPPRARSAKSWGIADGLLAPGLPVALGLDLPLGLPRAYAAARPEADFPAFLRGLADTPGFFEVSAGLDTVSPARPFYPARGIRGMTRAAHAAALGFAGPEGLSRWCDRATAERPAGAPVFWTLGANQSGKAAISAWRDWLVPALAARRTGAPADQLWPFQGGMQRAAGARGGGAGGGLSGRGVAALRVEAGRQQAGEGPRRALAPALLAVMAARGCCRTRPCRRVAEGFGADAAGEDRFDSAIGLLGLIAVLDGARPDFVPDDPWIRRWEGWVLGQTALPRPPLRP